MRLNSRRPWSVLSFLSPCCQVLGGVLDPMLLTFISSKYLESQWPTTMGGTFHELEATLGYIGLFFCATWLSRQHPSSNEVLPVVFIRWDCINDAAKAPKRPKQCNARRTEMKPEAWPHKTCDYIKPRKRHCAKHERGVCKNEGPRKRPQKEGLSL